MARWTIVVTYAQHSDELNGACITASFDFIEINFVMDLLLFISLCPQEIDEAIRAVTDMNPDYSVEKIEIERRTGTD